MLARCFAALLSGGLLLAGLVAPTSAAAVSANPALTEVQQQKTVRQQSKTKKFRIRKKDFGIHSFSAEPGTKSGAIRFIGPKWRDIEKVRGHFHWGTLDRHIANAESWGYDEIMFGLYGTPEWAGAKVPWPQFEEFGSRSTAQVKRLADWRRTVRKLVRRYKGRIDTYQVWNEATSWQFYQGTPKRLAKMTDIMHSVVERIDPSARVVSASVQTHNRDWFKRVVPDYLRQLRRLGWPIDGFAGHFYPVGTAGPNAVLRQYRMFNRALDRARLPARVERIGTEVNYDAGPTPDNRDHPLGRVRGDKAARYVARTYLDGWRSGLRGHYWYLWAPAHTMFPGVQMYNAELSGTRAYNTLAGWTVGARFLGCTKGRVVLCRFKKKGSRFRVIFTKKGTGSVRVRSRQRLCPVTGDACTSVRGRVKVVMMPHRLGG